MSRRQVVQLSRAARVAARIRIIGAALRKEFDVEDVIVIAGSLFAAAGVWIRFSPGDSLIVIGGLLLYLGLWHRTLITRALNNGTAR